MDQDADGVLVKRDAGLFLKSELKCYSHSYAPSALPPSGLCLAGKIKSAGKVQFSSRTY